MKPKTLTITTISGVLLLAPAWDFGQTAPQDNSESAKDKMEQAAKETKDYTYEKKDEFVSSMKVHLAKLNKSLDMLGDRIQKAGWKTKAKTKPEYDALREKVAQFGRQLDDAKRATHSTWETVKADSQNSYQNLKGEIRREHERINENL